MMRVIENRECIIYLVFFFFFMCECLTFFSSIEAQFIKLGYKVEQRSIEIELALKNN